MHSITIVGLGPGDPRHLTSAAAETLRSAERIWIRTASHPSIAALPPSVPVASCDDVYDGEETFEAVYRAIARRLIQAAEEEAVVYAVPGDPSVGEASVGLLRQMASQAGAKVSIVPGLSFIEPTLAALGWDGLDGLQLADATALASRHFPDLDPDRPALVAQVYGRLVASDLKLVLLAQYPPEHPVTLVSAAGTEDEISRTMPLAELDRTAAFGDLATLAVPPLPSVSSLLTMAEIVGHLRAPDGCPWDREQTHSSLRPFLLEEAYEALSALDADDLDALCEELGDVLLQIVLHAQLALEAGEFTLADVIAAINRKLLRRHPHVFGEAQAETAEDVRTSWDALKRQERREHGDADPYSGVPKVLPALARAQLVQRKAKAVAPESLPSASEFGPLFESLDAEPSDGQERAERFGAVLWALVATADLWGVDAETALRDAIERFVERTGRA